MVGGCCGTGKDKKVGIGLGLELVVRYSTSSFGLILFSDVLVDSLLVAIPGN